MKEEEKKKNSEESLSKEEIPQIDSQSNVAESKKVEEEEKVKEDPFELEYKTYRHLKTKTWNRDGVPEDLTKPVLINKLNLYYS